LLLLLAACDSLAALSGRAPAAAPSPAAAAASVPDRAEPSRAVAVMSGPRHAEPAMSPVVVRGRDLHAETGPAVPPPNRGSGAPGDVTLNFAGADIRDVVAEVLGGILKLNYVIDPDVSGPVNFSVNRPLRREEILPALEGVLNSRGATMVQTDGLIRILLLRKEGKPAGAAPMAQGPTAAFGQRTEVFPLRFIGAVDMQHVLEKVLPAGQAITPDDRRHLIAVQGSPAELKLAQDTIRVFDIDQLSGTSIALVPLSNADPAAIADELKNIFAATRKEADSDAIRFMPVARLNAVMIVSRSSHYMDEARAWIARLDRRRNPNERRVYVYNLQYSKAVQVGQKLQGLLSGLDIQFKVPGAPAGGDGLGGGAGEAGPPAARKPEDGKPTPAEPAVPSSPSPQADPPADSRGRVRIEADEAHNALLIAASARDYELIRQVLQGIDIPPLQVLIEVTVAEVLLNDKLNYGVEYFINSGRLNTLLTTRSTPVGIVPATPGFALSWVSGNFQPRAILEALSEVTETKVISTPRLLVLSNQTARLQVGDVVPIITQSATSTVTSNPLILNNVTYKETGVVLEVTPRVNSGGFVTMDVNQSVSDVVNTTTSTIDSPTIRQRRLTSTISVKSGDSILLGGLIQQKDERGNSGIPVLSELPGIGSLFGTRTNSLGRTELIMLMTPRVIANEDAARVTTARVEREFEAVLDANSMPRPRRPLR
jgi:general secretion pathway protein D